MARLDKDDLMLIACLVSVGMTTSVLTAFLMYFFGV